ncbi:MAG: SpoIIE family protein phosphatase [Vicinamibacterales bacterium]
MRPSLFQTLPGRLFLISAAPLAVLLIAQQFVVLPELLDVLRRVVTLGVVVAVVWLAVIGLARSRRRFLWRVRRKLILSYVFLGFVPVLLVGVFLLLASWFLYIVIVAYAFNEGFTDVIEDVRQVAETTATDIGRAPRDVQAALDGRYESARGRYPGLSLAVVGLPRVAGTGTSAPRGLAGQAGPWRHAPAPDALPAWVAVPGGFTGLLVFARPDNAGEIHLLIRVAVPVADGRLVVADLPVDADLVTRLEDRTGTRIEVVSVPAGTVVPGLAAPVQAGATAAQGGAAGLASDSLSVFRRGVVFEDFVEDWPTGSIGRATIMLAAPLGRIAQRITGPSAQIASVAAGALVVVGVLLLIVLGAAFFVGGILVRSITSAVHELFAGTERVQQGDFAHRIRIDSRDQLGDLADSFNRMGASIEHLLHVQREKQRLDDELRIAREIQKSLLPIEPPRIPGLTVADLCEPAREVGGDYYDFFLLGPRRLGVLIADVSGKGTSAALYMAELKGLMLALSHAERSPRRLLIDVNRHLADQLDNRSFITMTYAVVDLEAGMMTFARAGHTPLLVVSGGEPEVLVPPGMVVGLRLPGAEERFEELLVDQSVPIHPGDVFVLYTDGITEAMDTGGELFGDAGLERVVAANHEQEAAGIRERVLRDVRAFVGDAEPHDDMTMIVIKVGEGAGT